MPVTLRLVAAAVAWAGCTNSELARQTNGGLRAPIRVSIGWDRCAWPRACSMGRGYRPELIRMAIDRPDSNEPRPSVPPPLEDRRYRVLAETAPDAIVTLDERTCILSVNPAAERIFGWNADQMVGQSIEMLLPERNRSGHDASLSRYLRSGERNVSWSRVFVHALARDGREIPMEISFGEFLENGRRVFAGFMRDVSERVAQQQLLERTTGDLELALAELEARVHEAEAARTAADEANAAKSRFAKLDKNGDGFQCFGGPNVDSATPLGAPTCQHREPPSCRCVTPVPTSTPTTRRAWSPVTRPVRCSGEAEQAKPPQLYRARSRTCCRPSRR